MDPLTIPFVGQGWMFTPGPELMDEPTVSFCVQEISQHSAKSIAATLLAFPGIKLVHAAQPSWHEWKVEWRHNERFIGLTMTLFDDDETWLGSQIEAKCLVGDIIELWSHLQSEHDGVWILAPDDTMHIQSSLLEEIAADTDQIEIEQRGR